MMPGYLLQFGSHGHSVLFCFVAVFFFGGGGGGERALCMLYITYALYNAKVHENVSSKLQAAVFSSDVD